jgi:hypothetical protein
MSQEARFRRVWPPRASGGRRPSVRPRCCRPRPLPVRTARTRGGARRGGSVGAPEQPGELLLGTFWKTVKRRLDFQRLAADPSEAAAGAGAPQTMSQAPRQARAYGTTAGTFRRSARADGKRSTIARRRQMIGIVDSRLLFRYAFPGRVRLGRLRRPVSLPLTARNYGRGSNTHARVSPGRAQGSVTVRCQQKGRPRAPFSSKRRPLSVGLSRSR